MTDVLDRLLSETRKDNLATDSNSDREESDQETCIKRERGSKVQKADGKVTLDDGQDGQEDQSERLEDPIDQDGHTARFTPDSTVTHIYGSPGRGKSYLLRQMYMNPPIKKL